MKVVFFILGILVVLACLVLLFVPRFKIMLILSERTKSAYYSVAHKLISLTKGKIILLDDGSVSVVDKKSVFLQKKLPKELSNILARNGISKIKITNLEVYWSGGKKDNPFLSAMAGGFASVVMGVALAVMQNKGAGTSFDSRTDFKDTNFTLALSSKIKISVFSLLVVYIQSKKEYKKQLKLEENYGKV